VDFACDSSNLIFEISFLYTFGFFSARIEFREVLGFSSVVKEEKWGS
jgi:hypothetical protein